MSEMLQVFFIWRVPGSCAAVPSMRTYDKLRSHILACQTGKFSASVGDLLWFQIIFDVCFDTLWDYDRKQEPLDTKPATPVLVRV